MAEIYVLAINVIKLQMERMEKTLEATKSNFNTVRTGRASPNLLDRVEVKTTLCPESAFASLFRKNKILYQVMSNQYYNCTVSIEVIISESS